MIILIGGGFDTEIDFRPLIDECIAHANKAAPHMLFIPTGHFDNLEEHEEILEWFANAGCETDMLLVTQSTEEKIRAKIAWADIIYETGGNLDFLNKIWTQKGVFNAVQEAYARGAALIGVSTGAMCWAERGWDDFAEKTFRVIDSFPFLGEESGYDYRSGAGLVPFCVCPHFDNIAWRMFAFEAVKLDIPALAIENGAAVVCEGGAYTVISDAATPHRTAYLFAPDKKIVMADLKTDARLATMIAGERLLENDAD